MIGNYIGISFPILGIVFPRLEITLGYLFQYREWCFQDWKLHWDIFSNIGNGVSKIGNYIGISFPMSGMVFPRLEITLGYLFQYWEWCFHDWKLHWDIFSNFWNRVFNIGNGVSKIGNYIGISFPISGMLFPRLEITSGLLFQYREWCFQDWKLHRDFFSNIGNVVSKIGNYIGTSFPILGMVFPRLEITSGFLFQYREWCFQDWKLHLDFFSNIGNGASLEKYCNPIIEKCVSKNYIIPK